MSISPSGHLREPPSNLPSNSRAPRSTIYGGCYLKLQMELTLIIAHESKPHACNIAVRLGNMGYAIISNPLKVLQHLGVLQKSNQTRSWTLAGTAGSTA